MLETKGIRKLQRLNYVNTVKQKKAHKKSTLQLIQKKQAVKDTQPLIILNSDLCFIEKYGRIQQDFSFFNQYKHISSVAIRNDLQEKLITLLLEDDNNRPTTPWEELSNKYQKSIGPSFKAMGQSIEVFQTSCQQLIEDHEKLKLRNDSQTKLYQVQQSQKCASKRLEWFKTYPAYEFRFRLKENQFKCTELCLNESFVREAGFNLENFPNFALTEGIPQQVIFGKVTTNGSLYTHFNRIEFFHHDHQVNIENLHQILRNFTQEYVELTPYITKLMMKSGYMKTVKMQSFLMREIQGEDIIIGLFTIMDQKSLPDGSNSKVEYCEEFLTQLEERDKEKEYMLNTYYNQQYQGLFSNRNKVCQIVDIE